MNQTGCRFRQRAAGGLTRFHFAVGCVRRPKLCIGCPLSHSSIELLHVLCPSLSVTFLGITLTSAFLRFLKVELRIALRLFAPISIKLIILVSTHHLFLGTKQAIHISENLTPNPLKKLFVMILIHRVFLRLSPVSNTFQFGAKVDLIKRDDSRAEI
jgi:hypothetical protein